MKRIFDFAAALIAIVLLWPVMLIISVLIWLKLGRPVLFCQTRPGMHGKPFNIYKFRTMKIARDSNGELLPDHERMTVFGSCLRRFSLDELPQLFNVLLGELSLVGPRPLLIEYLPLYSAEQARRHDVRPGITGWAQVNGRNELSWSEKFELDVWYVDKHSFCLDMKILWMTLHQALVGRGINQEGQATAEKFMGNIENG